MIIRSLHLTNIRGFLNDGIKEFSETINIFVGKNNSGKSTLLKSIYILKNRNIFSEKDINVREITAQVQIGLKLREKSIFNNYFDSISFQPLDNKILYDYQSNDVNTIFLNHNNAKTVENFIRSFKNDELNSDFEIFIPFLNDRFIGTLEEKVDQRTTKIMKRDHLNITSKLDSLKSDSEELKKFNILVSKIFGFKIEPDQSENGKMIAIYQNDNAGRRKIFINNMGDGTVHIVGLLFYLLTAKNKIFIIEEIENYLHPHAIKEIMELIVEKSKENQFFICTHSGLVLNYLSKKKDSKFYHIKSDLIDGIPASKISDINNIRNKMLALSDIGCSLLDYDLWEAWLILEESSAETIINDFLIPWFVPELKDKLKTISSNGIGNVDKRAKAMNEFFIYSHLTPIYNKRCFILVDGDEAGKQVIDKFKQSFSNNESKDESEMFFKNLNEQFFENYYPQKFKAQVDEISVEQDNDKRRLLKKKLLVNVIEYLTQIDIEDAKKELKESAKNVIGILLEYKKYLNL